MGAKVRTTFQSYFTDREKQLVKDVVLEDRRHPLARLIFPTKRDCQAVANTEQPLRDVHERDPDWLKKVKPRLLNTQDYSEAASALAELRAYGYMIEAGIPAVPVKENSEKSPDFGIEFDGNRLPVEVYSKQMNKEEREALARFHNEPIQAKPGQNIICREHETTPFGKPKCGENVTENVISKIAGIKEEDKQLSRELPSILWLDFQDETLDLVLEADAAFPLMSDREGLYAGGVWYAFYGWKGAPIFEGKSTEERACRTFVRMQHKGRFRGGTLADTAVLAFGQSTVILDNPWSNKQLPPAISSALIRLPWFSIERSQMNWPVKDLLQRIDVTKRCVERMAEVAKYS